MDSGLQIQSHLFNDEGKCGMNVQAVKASKSADNNSDARVTRTALLVTDTIFPLLGRMLLSVIFVTSAIAKTFGWRLNLDYMRSNHLPMVPVLLACALAIEAGGAVCLLLGIYARIASVIMFLYLVPVTFLLHTFMGTQFQKNLGIMGGLLLLAAYGPGKLALDRRRTR